MRQAELGILTIMSPRAANQPCVALNTPSRWPFCEKGKKNATGGGGGSPPGRSAPVRGSSPPPAHQVSNVPLGRAPLGTHVAADGEATHK
ncbi:hypothetical protein MCOR25_009631, partial [Pyricularia grisea]